MKITNKHNKIIGFGSTVLLPGETKDIPAVYSEGHPLTDYYIANGWLEVIGGDNKNTAPKVDVTPKVENQKPLEPSMKLSREQLAVIAQEKGIEVSIDDTKKTILEKIETHESGANDDDADDDKDGENTGGDSEQ